MKGSLDMTKRHVELRYEVARNVAITREAAGLSQSEFGRRIDVSPQKIWNIENAVYFPDPATVIKICEEFNVTTDWIYRGIRSSVPAEMPGRLRTAAQRLLH